MWQDSAGALHGPSRSSHSHLSDGETALSSQPLPSLLENVGGSYFQLGTIVEGLPERGDVGL